MIIQQILDTTADSLPALSPAGYHAPREVLLLFRIRVE